MESDDLLNRWPDAERILDPLIDLPAPERRAAALAACSGDEELRRVMANLLQMAESGDPVPPLPAELLDDDADEAVPAQIGAYRIVGELGRGGMSRVFRAARADGPVAVPVAIKRLQRRHGAESQRRFDRERETLARLQHPHIARLLDGGVTGDGLPYIVMELVEGGPIDAYCAGHGLDTTARLQLFRQVCQAVEFAHARLIVHRDIKPANVFVDEHGAVKLLDFGIAKWLDELDDGLSLTRTQHRVLTPAHAAPEQFRGEPVTAATDVYQLGLLLYLLLTGRAAHQRSTHEAIARAVLDTEPQPPSQAARTGPHAGRSTAAGPDPPSGAALARRLAGDLDAIVLKALRREPSERYASVEALRRDIDNYLEHRPVTARRGSLLYGWRKYARRHRVGFAATAAASIALAVGVAGVAAQARVAAAERDRARAAESRATAVNSYLVHGLLAAAAPSGAQGRVLSVADVLANASHSVGFAFPGEPAIEADVRTALADSYASLGRFAEARTHAEAARQLLQRTTPRDEASVLRARGFLARLTIEEGRYAEARMEVEGVLADQLRLAGAAGPDVVRTRLLLSRVLREQGDLSSAEREARDALAAAARFPGDWSLNAQARSRLAEVLIDLGRGLEAEAVTRELVDLFRSRLSPTHPDVLAAMSQRMRALNGLLRFDEALSVAEELVVNCEQVFGPAHPETARARNLLALAHDRLGHRAEARANVEKALAIYRETLGASHADTLVVHRNLAIAVSRMEGPAAAEPIYREVLDRRRQAVGPHHRDTIESAIGLATVLVGVRDGAKLRAAALDVRRLCDDLAGDRASDPRSLDLCATFFLDAQPADMHDPERARVLATQAVTTEDRRHYLRLRTLARAQRALGDWSAALTTLREALALPQAIQSWTTEDEYVALMQEHATPAELEAWLLARLDQFRRLRGPDDRLMAKTERHLAKLYDRSGRRDEADARYAAVLAQLKKTVPDTDWEVGRAMSEFGERKAGRGAFAEAEPLLIGGFQSLVGDGRADKNIRETARARVAALYEAWNRPAAAEQWRRRALEPLPTAAGTR